MLGLARPSYVSIYQSSPHGVTDITSIASNLKRAYKYIYIYYICCHLTIIALSQTCSWRTAAIEYLIKAVRSTRAACSACVLLLHQALLSLLACCLLLFCLLLIAIEDHNGVIIPSRPAIILSSPSYPSALTQEMGVILRFVDLGPYALPPKSDDVT